MRRRSYSFLILAVVALPAAAQETGPSSEEILQSWLSSPHADSAAEAFLHWNEEGEIPGECAVCHSTTGFSDFVTAGGGVPMIDHPVSPGTTVECGACHAEGVPEMSPVIFPSGAEGEDTGASAVCTVCHQGRASGSDVTEAAGNLEEDAVSPELGFVNVHYSAAAATFLGGLVSGGYEYPGRSYGGRFDHVPPLDTCTTCHDPHSTEVALESCTGCHEGISDFTDIRTTEVDSDGDGDTTEGIGQEVGELHARLGAAITTYADEVSGAPIVYDAGSYPYFFVDSDADGEVDAEEATVPNRYQSWTPRLLKAAYNYQFVEKDGGAHVHNAHYVIQLMIDSIEDLASVAQVETEGLARP